MEHKSFDNFCNDTLHELYNKIGPTMRIIDTKINLLVLDYKNLKGKISLLEKLIVTIVVLLKKIMMIYYQHMVND